MSVRPWLALALVASSASATVDLLPWYASFSDRSGACGELEAGARMQMFFLNPGTTEFRGPVEVVVFHDLDGGARFSAADTEIARIEETTLWPPGRISDVTVVLPSGVIPPLELPLWFEVDPRGLVVEDDETNNAILGGYPCSNYGESDVPLADLVLIVDDVSVVAAPAPDCGSIARISARAGNIGAVDPATTVDAWAVPPAHADVVAPAPGGFTSFVIDVPIDGPTQVTLRLESSSGDMVPECGDGQNNECTVWADAGAVGSLAHPVGDTLFATGHGDPQAAIVTGDFDWSGDAGAPRPPGDAFVILASRRPEALQQEPGDPLRVPRWTSATPRSVGRSCQYILVAAVDECGRREP